MQIFNTVKPVYNGHPWDSKKWLFFKRQLLVLGCYYKIGDRWPLFRGGGQHRFDCTLKIAILHVTRRRINNLFIVMTKLKEK